MRLIPVGIMVLAVLQVVPFSLAAGPLDEPPLPNTQAADDRPPTPLEAVRRIALPEGFRATLFAGEPDLRQPIAFTFDDRGRLWVVECYSYPEWEAEETDRVLIFEDTDGDGRFDRRKVFWDKGTHLSGIQLGFGGVWLCSSPNLLFLPDADADDVPDGAPVVVLDGWNLREVQHNVVNGLTWGPDGWLYGRHGILGTSHVGKPGTPDAERVRLNCGIWRYHPTRKTFEVVVHGTTNPWGLDFDDHGEAFFTNNVIGHLWHMIPGAHYQRMNGLDFDPHVYRLLPACSDHTHWAGGDWTETREPVNQRPELGGGHAHSGGMIYLGDNWPDRYRHGIFMCNIHGHRINHDRLERVGAGFVARHADDLMIADNAWFRGVTIDYGPDGGVFISDWTDLGECHDSDGVHRSSGRIYKIVYGEPRAIEALDVARQSDRELVELQRHKNEWYVRHARRVLHERAAAGRDMSEAHTLLREMFSGNPDVTRKLRALWALWVTRGLDRERLAELLGHDDSHVRAWAVRLLVDSREPPAAVVEKLTALARREPSSLVRLHLASALGRIAPADRWTLAEALAGRAEDASDRDLPLMIWYGVEPLVPLDSRRAVALARTARVPLIRRHLARRVAIMASESDLGMAALIGLLREVDDARVQADVLSGILDALRGQRGVAMPRGWREAYARLSQSPNEPVRDVAQMLALTFGDAEAAASLRRTMMDTAAAPDVRRAALGTLVDHRAPDVAPLLHRLMEDRTTRGAALRGLAAYDHRETPDVIFRHYESLDIAERRDAVGTLTSRRPYALALLGAVRDGRIPRGDVSAFNVRVLRRYGDEQIDEQLGQVWGRAGDVADDKQALIAKYEAKLTEEYLKTADLSGGRAVFEKTCAQCHTLFGTGGDIGPDLTGSDRANLRYVLENVFDPSAVVGQDFKMVTVLTVDGRLLAGIVREENERALTIQTANQQVVLDRQDIEAQRRSSVSMMPDSLLDALSDSEIRDLVGYLASRVQIPLPAAAGR